MFLRVFFPSGQYYAAEAHDPSKPEWPPHPSRVFSALVASAYHSGSGITDLKRKTLEWIESLPPPSISSPKAHLLQAPVSYVPPGDVLGQKGKIGDEQYEHPVHRWRQPRHFPVAIILGEPVVYYGWEEDPEENLLIVLGEITAGVTHVGTSHSMAVMKSALGKMPQNPVFLPDINGTHFLRIPTPGRLEELDEVFLQNAGVRRPVPSCEPLASYRLMKDRPIQDQVFRSDFLTMRISGTMHGADTAAYLGRALRRAVMSVLGDDAPSAVHGHNGGIHVGWLPLPDVGHRHASGRIVGVGILFPKELDLKHRQELLRGIGRVRNLRLADGRVAQLATLEPGERVPIALLPRTWTQSCNIWATVTPVVLDRPPKRLTDEQVRQALSESLFFAGYPKPQYIEVSSFSLFEGAPPAFQVPADKPRYHAMVYFEEPIDGPVIAGRLRYFGVGLFRPVPYLLDGAPQ